jgi:hypothetical protein
VTRLIQLVADYGPGDLGFAEAVQRIALVAPDAELCVTRVASGDTLAAGLCVAQLALSGGPNGRLIAHDVAGPAGDRRLWIGRTRDGALVVGAGVGWAWSFVAPALRELCALDVPADAELALAVRHALANHPHSIYAVLGRDQVPAPPECVLVWTDRSGNLQTTLAAAPADRVTVRIGDFRAPARLGDARRVPSPGELVFEPGTQGLQRLTVGGGSAAERFGHPAAGTPVEVTSDGREREPAGQRGASAAARPRP